jgi:hypothetical protein
MRLLLPVCLLVLTCCATIPQTGALPSGEPLQLETTFETQRAMRPSRIGGAMLSDTPVGESQAVTLVQMRWVPKQGESPVDDEDFFRIAGDERSANQIASYREKSLWLHRGGVIAALAGLASVVATITINASSPRKMSDSGTVMLLSASTLVTGFGAATAAVGAAQLERDHHPVDLLRAHSAALTYNERLGYDTDPLPAIELDRPVRRMDQEAIATHQRRGTELLYKSFTRWLPSVDESSASK